MSSEKTKTGFQDTGSCTHVTRCKHKTDGTLKLEHVDEGLMSELFQKCEQGMGKPQGVTLRASHRGACQDAREES